MILIALLSHEDSDIFTEFYNFLKNTYLFNPKQITSDFSMGNINAIKKIFSNNEEIKMILCLFHLTLAWRQKQVKVD